jgi:hypothetical protein
VQKERQFQCPRHESGAATHCATCLPYTSTPNRQQNSEAGISGQFVPVLIAVVLQRYGELQWRDSTFNLLTES